MNSFKPVSSTVNQRGVSPLLGLDTFNVVSTVSLCKKFSKPVGVKKAHITVSLILLVAETGIEPVTRGFSIPK